MQTETINAWSAGFFDGEGSLSIFFLDTRGTHRGFNVRVVSQVSQINRAPLDVLSGAFGGKVQGPYLNKGKNRKAYYRWHLTGPKLKAFLESIQSFSVVKRTEIAIALKAISMKRPVGSAGGRRLTTANGFENIPFYEETVRNQFRLLKAELELINKAS